MTGWDALKTCGGTLRRRVRVAGGPWLEFRGVRVEDEDSEGAMLYRLELDRDDWEIEPHTVEVTREKLAGAWEEALKEMESRREIVPDIHFIPDFAVFCRALGLDP